jgi:tetratricopeptide (TPR) repeat protein
MKVTAGLVLAGVLLFGPSFNDPFHFDDTLITSDSNVTNPAHWAHFFNPLHLRQLTFFTFYLNHLFGGDDPSGYHLVNVGIHIANAVLLYWLLARFAEPWIALAAAGVFLVHPVQSEPVLYVYERSTLLACFFSLLALIALVKERRWLAVVMFLCAFESKESAIAVPLVVVLSGARVGRNERGLKPATTYLVAGILAVAALAILMYRHEATVGIGAAAQINPLRYLLTETRVVFTYLRLLVFPYPQSLEYDFQNVGSLLTVAVVAALLFAGWLLRHRVEGICILAFFILLAPTSSFIPSADAAFEHRLYLPMAAFALLVAYGLSKIGWRTPVAIAVFIILATLTLRRETVWSSDLTLWQDTVQHAPGKARVWFNLGGAYMNSDRENARKSFLHALELQPHFPEALYDLGVIEQGKKNWDLAVTYYQRAIEQQTDYWPAWNNMGNTLFAMGRQDPALRCFETTLRLNPDYWPAQYNIAVVHYLNGRYTEALPKLRIVLDWQPGFREARYLLATSLIQSGNRVYAEQELQRLGGMNATESRLTPTMILAPSRP